MHSFDDSETDDDDDECYISRHDFLPIQYDNRSTRFTNNVVTSLDSGSST